VRKDSVSSFYQQSNVLEILSKFFFGINIYFMLLSLIVSSSSFVKFAQILFPFLYLLTSLMDVLFCWFEAEHERRKTLVEDGFAVNITEYKTRGYYNNRLSPSLLRFVVDDFESIFFTTKLVRLMLHKEIIKSIGALIVLLATCIVFSNMDFIAVVMEAVFSAYVLYGSATLLAFYFRVKSIYYRLYGLLISEECTNKNLTPLTFAEVLEYESCKAYFKVRISTKLFKKMNTSLSKEWQNLEKQIICALEP